MQGDDKDFFKFRIGSQEVRNILPIWMEKYCVSLSS